MTVNTNLSLQSSGGQELMLGVSNNSYSVVMNAQQYHSTKSAVSRSQLVQMLRSPKHFLTYCSQPRPKETPSQLLGRLVHSAVLEPNDFANTVTHTSESKGTFAYKKFAHENQNKLILDTEYFERIVAMRDAIWQESVPFNCDTTFGEILQFGESEKTIFWTDEKTGIKLRIRVDNLFQCMIWDVKSVGDARADEFLFLQALPNDLDFQAAMYHEGVKAYTGESRNVGFIAVETNSPHLVGIHETGPGAEFFENGMRKFRYSLQQLAKARKNDDFSSFANKYHAIDKIPKKYVFTAPDL